MARASTPAFATTNAWGTWNTHYAGTTAGTMGADGYLQVRLTFASRQRLMGTPRSLRAGSRRLVDAKRREYAF